MHFHVWHFPRFAIRHSHWWHKQSIFLNTCFRASEAFLLTAMGVRAISLSSHCDDLKKMLLLTLVIWIMLSQQIMSSSTLPAKVKVVSAFPLLMVLFKRRGFHFDMKTVPPRAYTYPTHPIFFFLCCLFVFLPHFWKKETFVLLCILWCFFWVSSPSPAFCFFHPPQVTECPHSWWTNKWFEEDITAQQCCLAFNLELGSWL